MLYRKYRPQVFQDVVGQAHVVRTLQGALIHDRIGQGYLFSGPRGTGKTTIARIFAKAVNCDNRKKSGDPCNTCQACSSSNEGRSLDLIEIDGASNGRVDEIRALKESAGVAAPSGGYKVFLIDEVHMVTKEAFNALLKILEEPPAHVIFILATTDPHKIPLTVLSRVQRFDFKMPNQQEIFGKLKSIAEQEKISIEDEGLMAIAISAGGAFRDAEVALTKVISYTSGSKKISTEDITEILGLIPLNYHPEFLGYLASNDQAQALHLIHTLMNQGFNLEHFAKDFLEYTRKVLVTKVSPAILATSSAATPDSYAKAMGTFAQALDTNRLVQIILAMTDARQQIRTSPIPQLPLELAAIELTNTVEKA